ncbi:MAG: CRISPR-associated helicase Cas3' [Burkholderiaceae bacterium]
MKPEKRLAFSGLGPASRAVWAKSGDPIGHGLLAHLLDVAAVAETLLGIEPTSTRRWAAAAFGLEEHRVARWVAALAGLHDFGKCIPGFQAKWPDGMSIDRAGGLAFGVSACRMDRHDLATAALLKGAIQGLQVAESKWLRHAVQAISAHHGYHFLADEVNRGKPLNEAAQWSLAREEILQCYWQLLAPVGRPALAELSLAAVNWLAGLTSAADWIASNPEWFPLGERGFDDLDAYHEDACRLARIALARIGWRTSAPLLVAPADTDALLARIVGKATLTSRPLQRAGDWLLRDIRGPALVLVEAPMGEGKTELAFLAHLRLQAANGHRGFYVALPTQATGNAMFHRALVFLEAFAEGPMDVQLVHGGSAMNEDLRRLRDAHLRGDRLRDADSNDVHLRGIDESPAESLSASTWFSQRRRPLLSRYGVGTVDQALFAALNVKHHFVYLWGLSNRVVVLDEVHAYDTYTSGLIVALLRWLRALGCSVVLMSATLPAARRAELLRAWGVADAVAPTAYPRLLVADDGRVRHEHFEARPLPSIDLAGSGESLDKLAVLAVDLLEGGGCGAVIVNTVDRAQTLYATIRSRIGDDVSVLLFHARFPAEDRARCERRVLECFGADGERPMRALLIATQVAEQSLDIDFDFMISDLAPIDLLLQRAGRLHRHARERPVRHAKACLRVAGLQGERLPELKETAWGYIYEPYILLRTWALLGQERALDLPADIDRLVQAVYGDEPLPADLEAAVVEQIEIEPYGEHCARIQKERRESSHVAINPASEPEKAYQNRPRGNEEGEGAGLENKTRLGRESVTLVPVEVVDGGWRVRHGDAPFAPGRLPTDELARSLFLRHVKVSRKGLVLHFKCQELPVAFAHSLLRHCVPLPLHEGVYEKDGLRLRLDDLLGLVYEPSSTSNGTGM